MPAADMHRTAHRLNALLAIIKPNSSSLRFALRPDARWDEDTMGVFPAAANGCANVAFTVFFSLFNCGTPDAALLCRRHSFIESAINIPTAKVDNTKQKAAERPGLHRELQGQSCNRDAHL
jgi:hypothetical protein